MAVDWGMLSQYPNAGTAFNQAYTQGIATNRQNAERGAMAALVNNPNDPRAMSALAQADPATAMQFQQQRIQNAKMLLAEHQDNIVKGAEIIRSVNPTDQAGWDRALATAQQAGIDVSQVPTQFNPQYADSIVKLADAFKPQASDLQVVAIQPGGSALQFNKQTGQMVPLVMPNPGSAAPGSPALPTVSDQASYNAVPSGSSYRDPQGNVRTKGGQSSASPTGGF